MEDREMELRKIFSEEGELPEVVRQRVEEAYDTVYKQTAGMTGRKKGQDKVRRIGRLPRAAAVLLAGVLLLGGSAVATTAIRNRYERMKSMDQEEVEQLNKDIDQMGDLSYRFSRELTEVERRRLEVMRTAYKYNEAFPEGELGRLPAGEVYSGEGVLLYTSPKGTKNIIYLPERELTDEELLEIVEYNAKLSYVFYDKGEKNFAESGRWARKLTELTDEDMDYYYLAAFSSHFEITDGYCRVVNGVLDTRLDQPNVLSETEEKRYQQLEEAYLSDEAFPERELTVIETSEEYSGTGVALCRYDAHYYLPEEELTEEELLEIIDFRHKVMYACQRIADEIQIGKRSGFPNIITE